MNMAATYDDMHKFKMIMPCPEVIWPCTHLYFSSQFICHLPESIPSPELVDLYVRAVNTFF